MKLLRKLRMTNIDTDKSDLESKISDAEKKISDTSGLVKKNRFKY